MLRDDWTPTSPVLRRDVVRGFACDQIPARSDISFGSGVLGPAIRSSHVSAFPARSMTGFGAWRKPSAQTSAETVDEVLAHNSEGLLPRMPKGAVSEIRGQKREVVPIGIDGDLPFRLPAKSLRGRAE